MSEGAAARGQLARSPGQLAQRHLTGVHQAALIVDDDRPMRLAGERLLSGAGVATLAPATGGPALAALEAQADQVGVGTSCIARPGLDGTRPLRIIRPR